MTIKDTLAQLFKALGGDAAALNDNQTISDVIEDLTGVLSPKVIPWAVDPSNVYWGTPATDIQANVNVVNDAIIGNLKYLSSGQLVTDWGAGNFIALKFISLDPTITYKDIKVGLDPSEGSGLVNLDADMDGVFKITNKDTQKFKIVVTKNGKETAYTFNLTGLVCADA